jgi:hypothetical protein
MTTPVCPREHDVHVAATSGRWPAELESHVAGCETCQEVRFVTAALDTAPAQPPSTVEPRALFACARHVRQIHLESRVTSIVTMTQTAALVTIVAVLLSFVRWAEVAAAWPTLVSRDAALFASVGLVLVTIAGLSRFFAEEH